jgi:hypothetical protein
MKRHRKSTVRSTNRTRVVSFLVEGFLHIKDICDIVLEVFPFEVSTVVRDSFA